MIFETLIRLSTNPREVAENYRAGKEIWDDIFAKEFEEINEEETEKYINAHETDSENYLHYQLDLMIGERFAKVLNERLEEFEQKVGLGLYKDVFASLGFLRFYEKYTSEIDMIKTGSIIRAFRRSDCDLDIQHKAEKFWEFVTYRNRYGTHGLVQDMSETMLMLHNDPEQLAESYIVGSKIWSETYQAQYLKIRREEKDKMMASYAKSYDTKTSERIAVLLPQLETEMKNLCGENIYAEVMAVNIVLSFYDSLDGLTGENGFLLGEILKAFELSNCSNVLKEKIQNFYVQVRKR